MKRILSIMMILALLVVPTAFAAETGPVQWKDYSIKITDIQKGGMFAPANMTENEYCVSVYLTLDEKMAGDDALEKAFYTDLQLKDPAGNAYAAQVRMSRGADQTFLYSIPKTVEMDDLKLTVKAGEDEEGTAGEAAGEAAEEAAEEAAAGTGPVEIETDKGKITLTVAPADSFWGQEGGTAVKTRVGKTYHNGGSTFWAGSQLPLNRMEETKQRKMAMVAFTYSGLSEDEAADAIGAVGEQSSLSVDGQTYPVQCAWITGKMAAFFFECNPFENQTPSILLKDGGLIITP